MAVASVSSMKVCDITECPICLDIYKEPKALPCIHTFCLQCLDNHCKDKKQEKVACPLCRKVFAIPPGGNINLPNNFFIRQMLEVRQLAGVATDRKNNEQLCELCSDSDSAVIATSYCVECDQHICDRCSVTHKKLKVSISHQVVSCDADMASAKKRIKLIASYCDQHPAEQNRLYCDDCKIVACHLCFVDKHNGHRLTDVNKSADKLRELLKYDVVNVTKCALKKRQLVKQLEVDTNLFLEKVATTESEISQKYDEFISLMQSRKNQLMKELNMFKDKILKEVQIEKDEIERQAVITESFNRYCLELMKTGTACDISRTAHDLHARAKELLKTQDEHDCHRLSEVQITFKTSLSTTASVKNLIGELVTNDSVKYKDIPRCDFTMIPGKLSVHHVMPSTGLLQSSGKTVIGNEVFMVRNTSHVFVYKSSDFTLTRNIKISGSEQLTALVSCSHYNCLYLSDSKQMTIHRYDFTNYSLIDWYVGGKCCGLSVTKCYNVLVTLNDTKRILEYSTRGNLIREISLDRSIAGPHHCVQLSTDNYVVCRSGNQHCVCIVDQSGHIIQSYGGSSGSDVEQMSLPLHMTVDKYDNVLVADSGNDRVQLLSPTLSSLGDIVIPGHKLNGPCFLHFDELNRRLYIGEGENGRIFILAVEADKNI